MSTQHSVMIVDDDEIARVVLREFLEDAYDIIEASSADDCIEALDSCKPDIFLLDVQMPGRDGFDLCEEIRRREDCKATPVVFVSAAETEENIIKGFESGGNGFLEKPVKREKIKNIVKNKIAQTEKLALAQKNNEEAMRVAMEALTTSSELGVLIQFVKDSDKETSLKGIAKRLCEITETFGLKSCAMVLGATPIYVNCNEGSPEALLLKKASEINERIISKGIRSIIRSDSIAFMVTDMPVDDESRYGRFKDNLVVLASICDGRLKQLMAQQGSENQRTKVLSRVIKLTETQLQNFRQKLKEHEEESSTVINNMLTELESKLFHLDLDEDQEEQLMQVAYQVHERLEQMKDDYQSLEGELGKTLEALYQLFESTSPIDS